MSATIVPQSPDSSPLIRRPADVPSPAITPLRLHPITDAAMPPNASACSSSSSLARYQRVAMRFASSAAPGSGAAIPLAGSPTQRAGPFESPPYMGSSTPHIVTTQQTLNRLETGELTHVVPSRVSDHVCIKYVRGVRWLADKFFRERYIHRATMLTTVASCPAFAAAVLDHFAVIWGTARPRRFRATMGEAENHQVHLAVLGELVKPTLLDRLAVTVLQLANFVLFVLLFAVSPRAGHRLAAYLAEEACVMMTHLVNDIDVGKVADAAAPQLAVDYWGLAAKGGFASAASSSGADVAAATAPIDDDEPSGGGGDATEVVSNASRSTGTAAFAAATKPTLRDVVLLMRADNMVHRDAQHKMADEYERLSAARGAGTAFK